MWTVTVCGTQYHNKMDNTCHLHISNTILIYLNDSLFIYVGVLSGYDYDGKINITKKLH